MIDPGLRLVLGARILPSQRLGHTRRERGSVTRKPTPALSDRPRASSWDGNQRRTLDVVPRSISVTIPGLVARFTEDGAKQNALRVVRSLALSQV
jgi:hypothetical protein